jgi:hypothetical protein
VERASDISEPPNIPVNALVLDPRPPRQKPGTDPGVTAPDGGIDGLRFNAGLIVPVLDLAFSDDGRVVGATHFAAAWQ